MTKLENITPYELIQIIPEINKCNHYLSWQKLKDSDLELLQIIGKISVDDKIDKEINSNYSYWSPQYPIALNYFPNNGCEIYSDGYDFFLVYTDFGYHIPEKRCRVIKKSLIIYNKRPQT